MHIQRNESTSGHTGNISHTGYPDPKSAEGSEYRGAITLDRKRW